MPVPIPTVEELVSTLSKSNLPTVLVEGTSDARIYRRIEQMLGQNVADVLFCGGRNNLFEVFKRRKEAASTSVVFLADRDIGLFQNIPAEYSEIVWTTGYSIENDSYAGSGVEKLLEPQEQILFNRLLDSICEWFAFEVEEHRGGRLSYAGKGIGHILNDQRDGLRTEFLSARNYAKPSNEVVDQIRRNYELKLRGKTLFDLLAQVFHKRQGKEKYNHESLLWICISMERKPDYLTTLVETLKKRLNPQGTLPIVVSS